MSLTTPAKSETWNWQSMYKIPADSLDDLCSRFVVNVPEEERKDLVRLCFQIELAHWFYIDHYCTQEGSTLKQCSFKEFAANIFKHLSFLKNHLPTFETVMQEFREYKQAVPTYGAVLLNENMTHVLLVQGFWSKNSWGFPKGKVNEGEDPARCAAREVLEETGFDISATITGEFLETTVNDQLTRLYVVPGVPHDSKFVPRTRNEIRAVQWFALADLPSNKKDASTKTRLGFGAASFFMVLPFVRLIRNWVHMRLSNPNPPKPTPGNAATSGRKKQRRKSLDEASKTAPVHAAVAAAAVAAAAVAAAGDRPAKTSSEEDAEAKALAKSIAGATCVPVATKNPSRRQLFIDKVEPTKTSTRTRSSAGKGPSEAARATATYCAPSWLHFRLDTNSILACFD